MAKGYNLGSPPKLMSMTLEHFKGVDYQNNPVTMDTGRSPSAPNMIIDRSGYPQKRTGYRKILDAGQRINGIHTLKVGDTVKKLIHHGTILSLWNADNTLTNVYLDLKDERSTSFQKDKRLYILDGKAFLVYGEFDGAFSCKRVDSIAETSVVFIARKPTGGGVKYEGINMISDSRTYSFLGTATDTAYTLDTDITEVVKVEKLNTNGDWDVVDASSYTVNNTTGVVTFTAAPGVSPTTGADNIKIEFKKPNAEYKAMINKCTIANIFTVGAGDYIFLTGNDSHPNRDWRSKVNDPTVFSDLSYSTIGQDNTDIMAYVNLNGEQAIIKESNNQDVSIYIRSANVAENGTVSFPIKQGIASSGCVSKYCTTNLRDDNLFLSEDGVTSLNTSLVSQTSSHNRSYYVNPDLTKKNLRNAVAIVFDSKYYLAVDNQVYIADSRQKEYNRNDFSDSFIYEWCHWTDIPVRIWHNNDGILSFADNLGGLFEFQQANEYATGDVYKDEDRPVHAHWDTPFMDFGTISNYKTLKNMHMVLQPNIRTSVDISFKGKDSGSVPLTRYADMFDWNNIDFNRFSFISDGSPLVIPLNHKVKKFTLLQIRFANGLNEPFGLYKAQVSYTVNGKYKG